MLQIFVTTLFLVNLLGLLFCKLFFITANIHDIFIPINSFYAIADNLTLHQQFHSSFGLFYHLLQYLSYYFTEKFNLHIQAIFYICSIICSLILIGLCGLFCIKNKKLPYLTLFFVLILMFDVTKYTKIVSSDFRYYGTYNVQLYSFILIQSALFTIKILERKLLKNTNFILLSAVTAIILLITFLSKINFFISCGIMCFAYYLITKDSRFVLTTVVFFLFLTALTIYIFDYNILLYFEDLKESAIAKKSNFRYYKNIVRFSIILTLSLLYIFRDRLLKTKLMQKAQQIYRSVFTIMLRNKISKIIFSLKENKNFILFHFISLVGLFVSIKSDFAAPNIYLLYYIITVLSIHCFHNKIIQTILVMLIFFKLYNMINLNYKSYANIKYSESIKLTGSNKEIVFKIPSKNSLFSILLLDLYDDILYKLSYNNHLITGRKSDVSFTYLNKHYIKNLHDVLENLQKAKVDKKKDNIFMLEFSNPLRLFGYKLLDYNFHWIHKGTTHSFERLFYATNRIFENSDIVVMPIVGLDSDQCILNCNFYNYAFNSNQFVIWKITQYNIFFVKKSYLAKNINISEIDNFNYKKKEIQGKCNALYEFKRN
jgi:hypothetical protein